MKTYSELTPYIESKDYETHLWNALRGRHSNREVLDSGMNLSGNAHTLPSAAHDKYMAALKKESLFRNLATDIHAYGTDYRNGIIRGGNSDEFNGMWEDMMTREQLVTVLYRFAQKFGLS